MHIKNFTLAALSALVCALGVCPAPTEAAIIRVALDGSGDYDVLQDAVAAAQSGDTISIAPGVYTQTRMVPDPSGQSSEVMARVAQAELTIIGDDVASVVIGPATPAANLETGPDGIQANFGVDLTVRGLTIRHVNTGVSSIGTQLSVQDCRFITCERGVDTGVTIQVQISDVEITGVEAQGILISDVQGETPAIIERCSITDTSIGIDMQTEGNLVADCAVLRGTVGIQTSFAGTSQIVNCTLTGQGNVGIGVLGGSSVWANGNLISGAAQCFYVSGFLGGVENQLMGGSFATLRVLGRSVLDLHDNHILNSGGWSVRAESGANSIWTIDLTNNFWGTDDPAQIAEWIYDRNDSTNTWLLVDYQPFYGQPVSTTETSFGKVKAAFGQER